MIKRSKTLQQCSFGILLGILFILSFLLVSSTTGGFPTEIRPTNLHSDAAHFQPVTNADPTAFLSVWNTSCLSDGSTADNQIHLPLIPSGSSYDFVVQWGDDTSNVITSYFDTNVTHTYASPGIYAVNITGHLTGWQFNNDGDKLKLCEISQWGSVNLGNVGSYFYGCANFNLTATDTLSLMGTTTLYRAFSACTNLGSTGNMNSWDVSSVTNMYEMFSLASTFNQDLGNWDVSSVTTMEGMFAATLAFNQAIGDWDVSRVTNMEWMFAAASDFNQAIGDWDVSSVTTMNYMFTATSAFNQAIGDWDVSSVTSMDYMFYLASTFNQAIGDWDVSSVTSMGAMFYEAFAFNQAIGGWDVSSVTNIWAIFYGASTFNQAIGDWDISRVTSMQGIFNDAFAFNQSIGDWDVSSVTDMGLMFDGATAFNQDLSSWDVSSVTDMGMMFSHATTFNQNLGGWNVSNVTSMYCMFYEATAFNQDLGGWNVSNVTSMSGMFTGATLSTPIYDSLLQGWSHLTLQPGVTFDAGNSQYSLDSDAATARQDIIDKYGWTISDGGGIFVDDIYPTWVQIPQNQTIGSGEAFRYDVNATDNEAISHYWLNDTSLFQIDATGVITNTTTLESGIYYLEVFVNDTSGNTLSVIFSITVFALETENIPGFPIGWVLGCIGITSLGLIKRQRRHAF